MIQLKNLERSYKTPAGQFWVLRRMALGVTRSNLRRLVFRPGFITVAAA